MDQTNPSDAAGTGTSATMWQTWKQVCAAALCPPPVAEGLRSFGSHRFVHYYRRYGARTGHAGGGLGTEISHAWHLLETHMQVDRNRAGKRYKDWLFARAPATDPNWCSVMEAGASLLMRDVVREHLRRERAPDFMQSIQAPSQGSNHACSLEELLPGHIELQGEVAERELDQLACTWAENTLQTLSEEEQMILFARGSGIALTDPALLRVLKCSKSAAHRSYTQCVERLCGEIRRIYADEEPAWWVALAQRTLEAMHQQLFLKINREKGRLRFFITKRKKNGEQQDAQ